MTKYGAKKVTIRGITFDSQAEAEYYLYLLAQQQSGEVKSFTLQPKYTLQKAFTDHFGNKHQTISYIADFYVEYADGTSAVIDVKGMETTDFKIKKKLFIFTHPHMRMKCVTKEWGMWFDLDELKKMKAKQRRMAKRK